MRIWLLEPYFTGSHQAWAVGFARHSQHQVDLLTMAGRFWKWRMTGALELAASPSTPGGRRCARPAAGERHGQPACAAGPGAPALSAAHRLLCTREPVDVSCLRAGRDLSYALINLLSMAAASRVCFNSRFHLESWFEDTAAAAQTLS
ncbi:tRNA-queuosine alpha-mannosyltransferase domain-containing protein [Candidatus Amarolinea aalborgensis]|uniref:tRNA-queuosine alpha-mannosyltransferase domain-containing protein n=1 Tax=Candidatus Amarolinea aalborgensis TaxID=2249329 RepID=UPI003BF9C9EC